MESSISATSNTSKNIKEESTQNNTISISDRSEELNIDNIISSESDSMMEGKIIKANRELLSPSRIENNLDEASTAQSSEIFRNEFGLTTEAGNNSNYLLDSEELNSDAVSNSSAKSRSVSNKSNESNYFMDKEFLTSMNETSISDFESSVNGKSKHKKFLDLLDNIIDNESNNYSNSLENNSDNELLEGGAKKTKRAKSKSKSKKTVSTESELDFESVSSSEEEGIGKTRERYKHIKRPKNPYVSEMQEQAIIDRLPKGFSGRLPDEMQNQLPSLGMGMQDASMQDLSGASGIDMSGMGMQGMPGMGMQGMGMPRYGHARCTRNGNAWNGYAWYAWYGNAWYGNAWYGNAWYGYAWYGYAWYGYAWYGYGNA